jgi:hypothetical protein
MWQLTWPAFLHMHSDSYHHVVGCHMVASNGSGFRSLMWFWWSDLLLLLLLVWLVLVLL